MSLFDRFRAAKRRASGKDNGPAPAATARASRLVDEGNQLEDQGRLDEAMQRYASAIELAPGDARAHLNLGNVLLASGDAQAALAAYARALEARPGYAAAHYNMGNAYARLGRQHTALGCYHKALQLKSDFVDAEVALGNAQTALRMLDDAAASFRRALVLRPDYAQVHFNLGNVLQQVGRVDALRSFREAADLQADFGAAAAQAFHWANQLCDWTRRGADEAALVDMVVRDVPGISPFVLLSLDPRHIDAALLQRRAALCFAGDMPGGSPAGTPPSPRARLPGERLRIAYLSADFHEHATMHLLGGVLAAHDRARFAIHGYSYGTTGDAVTARARASCDVFRDLAALPDAAAAAVIAADGIDILVDLKGFTTGARMQIAALRPAPVSVSWLGYPGTLGHLALADYLVGDPVVTPPEHAAHFSETLALLPHCYQPNDRTRRIGRKPGRAEAGLPETGFVFCSFNQSYKFNPESFDVWCRLLDQVPGSVLWLLPTSAPMAGNLRREAVARCIAADRLVFAPMLPQAEHLGRLQLADLALDTFPYNSHTTGSDALWAGVPIVTRMGNTFASRVAASLLGAAGLPELVTQGWDDYFDLAKSLALDEQRLAALRRRLVAGRASVPLFDTERFTRDLERLYGRIWEQATGGVREVIVLPAADAPA
ncbi:MAG: tetratricopeptide repeat protein [Betaproteobacteria bacterium]|nr:tetratricopeptide repeat protein [Betaproteobacteria bacterium]